MSKYRKLGAVVLAAALLGGAAAAYTMAGFTAQTRNPNNVFGSGTLVLSNTKQPAGTTCFSTAGGTTDSNVNNNCDTLINTLVAKPGDSATGRVTIKNEGSIAGSAFTVYMNNCATANASGETYNGTGDFCANTRFYIQEFTSAAYDTPSACIYGAATVNTCNFTDNTKTLANYASTYPVGSQQSLGSLAAGASRYFEIGVNFPSASGNTFQGRAATFDVTWVLTQ